ncbi:hypothetical protein [Janthinobacterium sp. PAMC25594]|uniref:hypothetical protein n=1 Tax=Janthinobacterium sp. PAMC25594 TaxID=2861284 RepID=UPI001C6248BF|nr:hypothetical protein [Janthinobacterium sp. PAMC25594]QYG07684.1 hypothetical protein KY494_02340 [Janthinobacterium sp. PAMC25594]
MQEQLFFEGLRALAEAAFPKHCACCGRVFATADEFIGQTRAMRQNVSGLKQSFDDNNVAIVEVYRNCPCGSTLMDFFSDRRDTSEPCQQRRLLFERLLPLLQEKGMERGAARAYLLQVVRGELP